MNDPQTLALPRTTTLPTRRASSAFSLNLAHRIKKLAHTVGDLMYPRICVSCGNEHASLQDIACTPCLYQLPQTQHHLLPENPFTDRLQGRVRLEFGAALFYFSHHGKVRKLIHDLKYHQRPDIGERLGAWYGAQLARAQCLDSVDVVIPVPLHPRKLHQRGYNQAACIARGLAQRLQLPVCETALERSDFRSSQTQKSRTERLQNTLDAFRAHRVANLAHKHILLVDDVLTTGATLEACAQALADIPGIRISMVTLAMAES